MDTHVWRKCALCALFSSYLRTSLSPFLSVILSALVCAMIDVACGVYIIVGRGGRGHVDSLKDMRCSFRLGLRLQNWMMHLVRRRVPTHGVLMLA